MKEGIHPKYEQTTIRCACGAVIETGSTKKDIKVEICSKCHPFYTGKQKLVDTGGRVDRFNKKYVGWVMCITDTRSAVRTFFIYVAICKKLTEDDTWKN